MHFGIITVAEMHYLTKMSTTTLQHKWQVLTIPVSLIIQITVIQSLGLNPFLLKCCTSDVLGAKYK